MRSKAKIEMRFMVWNSYGILALEAFLLMRPSKKRCQAFTHACANGGERELSRERSGSDIRENNAALPETASRSQ